MSKLTATLLLTCGLVAYGVSMSALAQTPSAATPATIAANNAFSSTLPWSDESEIALSRRGFIATLADPKIRNAAGQVVMDLSAWDFATGPAPSTANPSLWRHAGLLRQHGLFKVADKIWQVRGFDISVMSIIETDTGYLIVDPLTSVETARAAMGLVRQYVGNKPVKAVIYTHSHADHFGGVKGVIDPVDVASGKVQIIAPDGFMEHAVSENLIAGPAMSRRAAYQFGTPLEEGPAGHMGAGIGMRVPSGALSLIAPTHSVKATGETLIVDGLKIEFQYTPGTEAPSEMNFFLPDLNALCLSENANVSMHNILPPRGALVRDSKAWADYLTQSLALFGGKADVMFVSHGWPRWGRTEINQYVGLHRDAYKYLHDQSVRLMNQGLNGAEIAEEIALPEVLSRQWYNRGYYGTMRHNSRAVYQRYLGWYDGNPANLNNWPPEEAGKRYVAAMGGSRKALREASKAFEAGDYRWSAELAKHIVFADASNVAAREVLAKSFEQMGYQAESMLWRNMYLVGAQEARTTPTAPTRSTVAIDLIAATQTTQLFDLLAIRVDPAKAAGKDIAVAFVFPERRERIRVTLRNSVMIHETPGAGDVTATITLPRAAFLGMLFAGTTPASLVQAGTMKIDGERTVLQSLLGSLDGAGTGVPFPLVTP
jgi:alkyl sulfatase BDS1-like metallo-beta-lactamase superfamily hydrolase